MLPHHRTKDLSFILEKSTLEKIKGLPEVLAGTESNNIKYTAYTFTEKIVELLLGLLAKTKCRKDSEM